MSSRYLVIHGHFYQPPRENPWILAIEPQETAAPFANWNLRINRECYAPNTRARLLDAKGRIRKLVNNYQYLSFNFGPTLLTWLEKADPGTYRQIIEADCQAAQMRDGHGSALAQVYNHIIMPLATDHDRLTQIRWGLADFEARFGRRPEGMWLAETAADLKTLKMLAQEGLKFTILSQGQASAIRPLAARVEGKTSPAGQVGERLSPGGGLRPEGQAPEPGPLRGSNQAADLAGWEDVSGGRIDPREPYRVFWGPGPDDYLDVFFYDGPVSRAIAFEQLLRDGSHLLSRIEQAFGQARADGGPRLVNLATDGESYGHHFTFGEMALAWLFDHLEKRSGQPEAIELTNYGHYLALFPPTREARIFDNSSWSCVHGVERWRSDCGCRTGGQSQWNQKWRKPLREGLDWLRDQLALAFETRGGELLRDPWAARDDYVQLLLAEYRPEARERFIGRHQARPLSPEELTTVLSLLESQLMGLYMFTSCGWFFDEISGLEPVQNLRYALRAIELAQPWLPTDLTGGLTDYLAAIVPNNTEYATGLDVWRSLVAPDSLSDRDLAAHWAAATLLDIPEMMDVINFPIFQRRVANNLPGEGLEVMAGQVDLHDPRLAATKSQLCLAIYSGSTHLAILAGEGGSPTADGPAEVPDWLDRDKLEAALGEHLKATATVNIWDFMLSLMPLTSRYVIEDLLPACRRILLAALVNGIYDHLKDQTRDLFHLHQHLLLMKRAAGQPMDWVERFIFRVMGETELQRILSPAESDRPVNLAALANLLNRRGLLGLARDESTLAEFGRLFLKNVFHALATSPRPGRLLAEMAGFISLTQAGKFEFDLWESQNQWYSLSRTSAWTSRLTQEEAALMVELGAALGFALEETGS